MEKYDYFLDACLEFSDKAKQKVLKQAGDSKEVYRMSEKQIKAILGERKAELFLEKRAQWDLDRAYEEMKAKGIRLISLHMEEYPKRLLNISDPPFALYVRGKLPEEGRLSVAVIGARDCSAYGEYVAGALGKMLGEQGITVISGMARGIDGISQMAALEAGGVSFGVLGCGVDVCYPKKNREIYDRLLEKGGILSSYLPGTAPRAALFPPRNRIVSGLCDVLVVIEARQRSGTSITVEMALEQGRDVYAVPGRLTDRLSDGCNRLLKDGAQVFLSPKEFVEELSMRYGGTLSLSSKEVKAPISMGEHFSKEELAVYAALDAYPMPVDRIAEKVARKNSASGMDLSRVMITLMELCIKGFAIQSSNGWFSKSL